jgi:aryl-alcohol dehydrogenase-like predicted oxidoreductase
MQFRPLGRTNETIPVVGLGTWGIGGEMGPDSSRDEAGIEALRLGLDLEMRFIDTAEMYGAGHSEEVVARALEGRHDRVFVASKVSPRHFAYDELLAAAKRSLKRHRVKADGSLPVALAELEDSYFGDNEGDGEACR